MAPVNRIPAISLPATNQRDSYSTAYIPCSNCSVLIHTGRNPLIYAIFFSWPGTILKWSYRQYWPKMVLAVFPQLLRHTGADKGTLPGSDNWIFIHLRHFYTLLTYKLNFIARGRFYAQSVRSAWRFNIGYPSANLTVSRSKRTREG